MKMEYLPTGSTDCPLIRLYDFTLDEVVQLFGVFASLASDAVRTVGLHEQSYVQPIDECRLVLRVAERDQGIVQLDAHSFACVLTEDGWKDEEERAIALVGDGCRGDFQWLLWGIPSEVRLLLSWDGRW